MTPTSTLLPLLLLTSLASLRAAPPALLTQHLLTTADLAELRDLEAEWTQGVLKLSTSKTHRQAWAVIRAPKESWNLAQKSTVTAEVTNTGAASVGVMLWLVGEHGWSAVVDAATLAPREKRVFSCNLRAGYPDGTPKLNPGGLNQVQVMLCEPVGASGKERYSPIITKPIAVEIRQLTAQGDQPEWSRPPGRIEVPAVEDMPPAPGKRVRYRLPGDENSGIYSVLNLPENWEPGNHYPLIVEYPGNVFYANACYSTGKPEQCIIGYGMTKGRGAICIGLPFLDRATGTLAENGWGNADDTADYALQMVDEVCSKFGGDRENVVLTGFSRGAIACGYIGLRNERIATLWKGFHACQHYDGDGWNGATLSGALERAARFRGKAVFQTDNAQETFHPVMDKMNATVTWAESGLGFHSTAMFLDDRASTQRLREWFWKLVEKPCPQ